jgi:hypothetical protein
MSWICPHCDSVNSEGYVRCACGYDITEEKQQRAISSSDAPSQETPVMPAIPRHISKLRRAFWASLGAIIFSMIFLLIAYNYPQLILGPAPGLPQYDPQSDYASAQIMSGQLQALNYSGNKKVLKDVAEAIVFWTSAAGLVLFILVREEERRC